jgi:hypothetical protein
MKTEKKLLTLLLVLLSSHLLFAQQTITETVYFDYGKYELTPEAKDILDKSCKKTGNKEFRITLSGHTDADGSDEYNLLLSRSRTKAVMDHLLSQGLSANNISVKNFGEGKPVAQNENEPDKQQNRRVEIIIEKKQPVISDPFSRLGKEAQTFTVNTSENIEIKGKEGTVISIPGNSLVKENGQAINGNIKIELKEFYRKSDFITSNLHTMSDKAMLESGGMIHISATAAGAKLKLKKGAEMKIEFAASKRIEGMGLFKGEEKDGQINWVPQNTNTRAVEGTSANVLSPIPEQDLYDNGKMLKGRTKAETLKVAEIDRMVLSSGSLGWINCDRFYNNRNRTNLKVELDHAYKPVVRLVFKNINSVMPAYLDSDGKFIFSGIPVGQAATLVAFGMVDEEPWFVSRDIRISENQEVNLELVKTTMEELKKQLEKLN